MILADVNKEEARRWFIDQVSNFYDDYREDVLEDFCRYWCEPVTFKGKKMLRFQKEHEFDFNRRLKSWARQGQPGKTKEQLKAELTQKVEKFRERVFAFDVQYPREMLDSFFLYWAETSEEGTEMRWQKQPTFNLQMRLQTWAKNQEKYGNNRKPFKARDPQRDYTFEEFERDKRAGKF